MNVKITQFIAPYGKQRERSCEVPNDCAVGYEAMKRHNCRLTAEVLSTGLVSQTVEHEEGDFLMEITPNGPAVLEALVKMLREFTSEGFTSWLKAINEPDGVKDYEAREPAACTESEVPPIRELDTNDPAAYYEYLYVQREEQLRIALAELKSLKQSHKTLMEALKVARRNLQFLPPEGVEDQIDAALIEGETK